jgi:hypothetical protein
VVGIAHFFWQTLILKVQFLQPATLVEIMRAYLPFVRNSLNLGFQTFGGMGMMALW